MWFWFSNHYFQNDFDFKSLYLADLILKSSTYDDFVHSRLWVFGYGGGPGTFLPLGLDSLSLDSDSRV